MSLSRMDLLREQFDLTWFLFEYHLARLTPEDTLWEPAGTCWTVRPGPDGLWRPDWSETEPEPVPVPTIGWLTWHIGWWWGAALDHVHDRAPRPREEITWPGDTAAAVTWLRDLRAEWIVTLEQLGDEGLDAPATFPWQEERTVGQLVAWLNVELAKNVTEIGQLRMLRAASPT